MSIKIEVATEVEITADEYRKRIGWQEEMPRHAIGEIVEYPGEYKAPAVALITGVEMRSGGWMYHGLTLKRFSVAKVVFGEKEVIRSLAKSAEKECGE